ncbi:MAG: DNA repair protein RadA/Sms [Limisphaerales bacterium]|jgi:DNA repair protein RadA/Sms
MAKSRSAFFCQNCGASSAKWIGKCPSCEEWNTYVEEVIESSSKQSEWEAASADVGTKKKRENRPILLSQVETEVQARIPSFDAELDRVLGGGIVPGSVVLVGGEPGIGKSTLMLQVGLSLDGIKVLYISGEESSSQVKMRADRIGKTNSELFILTETALPKVFRQIKKLEPDIIIADSIQTLHTDKVDAPAGSVSQIRTCAGELQRFAKESNVPVFVIGHINKEGAIAGPKILEHMVDTVLQFEGDRHHNYRILRTIKNRFGSTSELGIYQMNSDGLREIANPSEILLGQREEAVSGIAIATTIEGLRPMLIETQILVAPAVYGNPQRSVTGFDLRRLNMLLAVLEKRCGFPFGARDVYLNIAGGLRVEDPAIDLAVVAALLSSFDDKPLPLDMAFCGEVGLSGEVRAVPRIEPRIAEASKLGYRRMVIASFNTKGLDLDKYDIKIEPVSRVDELYHKLMT